MARKYVSLASGNFFRDDAEINSDWNVFTWQRLPERPQKQSASQLIDASTAADAEEEE